LGKWYFDFIAVSSIAWVKKKKKELKTQYSTDNNAGTWQEVLKNDTVVVQGCKSQSLIKDCSKTYRTTHDKIFTVDL